MSDSRPAGNDKTPSTSKQDSRSGPNLAEIAQRPKPSAGRRTRAAGISVCSEARDASADPLAARRARRRGPIWPHRTTVRRPATAERGGPVWGRDETQAKNSEHAAERVGPEEVAELEILVEHGVALVAAELLEAGGVGPAVHATGQSAALKAVAAERRGIESRRRSTALDNTRDGVRIDGVDADHRGGRGPAPLRWVGGAQMRRNRGPSVMPAASCQRRSARTGRRSDLP